MFKKIGVIACAILCIAVAPSYGAGNEGTVTEDQLVDACTGIALAQVSVITTLLSHPRDSMPLDSLKSLSIMTATKLTDLSDITRLSIASHINGFTKEHVDQMEQAFAAAGVKSVKTRKKMLVAIVPTIPEMMKEKFIDCRDEATSAGLVR
jgi:hypothetical protein